MTRRIADRYLLGEQVGAGATSRVHAAFDERLGRRVAIKLLDARLVASADPGGRERFLREGPTAASFSHPNAVTVFDAGEDDGDLYIVMELVEGSSLAEVLARTGPMSIDEAVRIASQVLAALASAHAVGIVHRDVKPANVLLGAHGVAKLADFGIAKRFDDLDDSVTRTGTVIGTPRYLAPEQATGAAITPATDVYAMGILLFEMLSGRTPFPGASPIAIVLAQQSQAAPDLRSLRPDVSPRLAATVARALERNLSARYPSAVEMAADIDNAWSPPNNSSPETAIVTQLIDVIEPSAVGVRSGETQILPVAAVATVAAVAVAPTVVAERAAASVPAVMAPRRRFPMMAIAIVAVIAIVVGLAVAGSGLGKRGTLQLAASGTGATTAPQTTSAAAPVQVTSPALGDIIAGFPITADLAVFLEQLQRDPTRVGTAGASLADELAKVLSEHSARKQAGKASELLDHLASWVDAGELDPAIAAALVPLLTTLAEPVGK